MLETSPWYINQSENRPRANHTLLLEHYKTPPHYPPHQGESHSLKAISPLWPPLPGKAIKASLVLTQNFVFHASIRQQWAEAEFRQQKQRY